MTGSDLPIRLIVLRHYDGYTARLKADRSRTADGQTEDEACRNLIDQLWRDYEELKKINGVGLGARDKDYFAILDGIFKNKSAEARTE